MVLLNTSYFSFTAFNKQADTCYMLKNVFKMAVLASVRNIVLFSALSFEFFQTLLVHFLFVDRHLRSDAEIFHSSTLVLP
jgi:hypothetical protein